MQKGRKRNHFRALNVIFFLIFIIFLLHINIGNFHFHITTSSLPGQLLAPNGCFPKCHGKNSLGKISFNIFLVQSISNVSWYKTFVQSLQYETEKIGVFWEFLWHKNVICMNCETYTSLECAPKPVWPTGFEKSEIHQLNLEILQF